MFSKLTESRGEDSTNFCILGAGRGLSLHQVGRAGEGVGVGEVTRLGWLQMFLSCWITVQTDDRSPVCNKS